MIGLTPPKDPDRNKYPVPGLPQGEGSQSVRRGEKNIVKFSGRGGRGLELGLGLVGASAPAHPPQRGVLIPSHHFPGPSCPLLLPPSLLLPPRPPPSFPLSLSALLSLGIVIPLASWLRRLASRRWRIGWAWPLPRVPTRRRAADELSFSASRPPASSGHLERSFGSSELFW